MGEAISMHDTQKSLGGRQLEPVPPTQRAQAAARAPNRPHASGKSFSAAARQKRRRKTRNRWLMAFLAVLTAGLIGGWWQFHQATRQRQESAVASASVTRRDFSSSVLATGAVRAQVGAEVRVGARLSGKVERLLVNIGDKVTQGQVLAVLEQADLQALVAQREAELELAEAKLAAVQNLLPREIQRAELDMSRWRATRRLYQQEIARESRLLDSDATSEQIFEQAQERLAVTEAQLAQAEQAHELAKARHDEERRQALAEIARARSSRQHAQVQLSYATVTAPIDGVIASVSTEEGETVAAGMQAPTFVTIIDLERLQVDAYVDEVDIGKVQVGQRALFTVDAFPATEFQGQVSAIYPKAVVQDNVVYYDVVVDIETPYSGRLRPEMTTSVTILLEKRQDVLAIPATAVRRERGRNMVHVVTGADTEPREIKTGWRDGPWIEVAAGLEDDEVVLLTAPTPDAN
jgi:HlyD family secretion protein